MTESKTYRKNPVEIRSIQFTGGNVTDISDAFGTEGIYGPTEKNPDYLILTTVHGDEAPCRAGDWVIPEPVAGRFYPCKPDIFAATYTLVTEAKEGEWSPAIDERVIGVSQYGETIFGWFRCWAGGGAGAEKYAVIYDEGSKEQTEVLRHTLTPFPKNDVDRRTGWVALAGQIVGAASWQTVYNWDHVFYSTKREALAAGFPLAGGTDDFNVGFVANGRLVCFGWGSELHPEEDYAEVANQFGWTAPAPVVEAEAADAKS